MSDRVQRAEEKYGENNNLKIKASVKPNPRKTINAQLPYTVLKKASAIMNGLARNLNLNQGAALYLKSASTEDCPLRAILRDSCSSRRIERLNWKM